jgi:benzoylformate decarboxylase
MALARDIIFDYLRDLEVRYIFGVPGTNEIPIIDGTSIPENGVTYVPCLHENIAIGAATGYARMTGKPGVVELHVTPGAGHGIGNLFNAYKSHGPVVVLCGQQHSQLLLQEPLLYSETVRLAQQYTKWAYEVRSPEEFPIVMQRALKVALAPPTGPVFISIPWDFTLQEVSQAGVGKVTRVARHFTGDQTAVTAAANRLAEAKNPIIVVGDGVGYANAWEEIQTLAELVGAPVYSEPLSSMMNYPNNLYQWQGELPGTQVAMQQRFAGHDVAFLCGFNAQAQLVIYDYALGPLIPESVAQIYLHDDPWEIGKNAYGEVAILGDIKTTMPLLCDQIRQHPAHDQSAANVRSRRLRELDGKRDALFSTYAAGLARANSARLAAASGPPPAIQGSQVAKLLGEIEAEENLPLIYVHEAISDAQYFQEYLQYSSPTSYYSVEGGSLGYSMPASLGIKLAVGNEHVVINAIGDGSTLFYPQVWWTAAKFNLPILTLILNNREYKTLLAGLEQITQLYDWKPTGEPWYLYLNEPQLTFPEIAASFGVTQGAVVSDPAALKDALKQAIAVVQGGSPYVLEVRTDPSLAPPSKVPEPRLDVLFAAKSGLL